MRRRTCARRTACCTTAARPSCRSTTGRGTAKRSAATSTAPTTMPRIFARCVRRRASTSPRTWATCAASARSCCARRRWQDRRPMDAELWYRLDARDDDPAFFYPNFAPVPALSAPGRDPPPVFPQRRNAGRAGPARCLPCLPRSSTASSTALAGSICRRMEPLKRPRTTPAGERSALVRHRTCNPRARHDIEGDASLAYALVIVLRLHAAVAGGDRVDVAAGDHRVRGALAGERTRRRLAALVEEQLADGFVVHGASVSSFALPSMGFASALTVDCGGSVTGHGEATTDHSTSAAKSARNRNTAIIWQRATHPCSRGPRLSMTSSRLTTTALQVAPQCAGDGGEL